MGLSRAVFWLGPDARDVGIGGVGDSAKSLELGARLANASNADAAPCVAARAVARRFLCVRCILRRRRAAAAVRLSHRHWRKLGLRILFAACRLFARAAHRRVGACAAESAVDDHSLASHSALADGLCVFARRARRFDAASSVGYICDFARRVARVGRRRGISVFPRDLQNVRARRRRRRRFGRVERTALVVHVLEFRLASRGVGARARRFTVWRARVDDARGTPQSRYDCWILFGRAKCDLSSRAGGGGIAVGRAWHLSAWRAKKSRGNFLARRRNRFIDATLFLSDAAASARFYSRVLRTRAARDWFARVCAAFGRLWLVALSLEARGGSHHSDAVVVRNHCARMGLGRAAFDAGGGNVIAVCLVAFARGPRTARGVVSRRRRERVLYRAVPSAVSAAVSIRFSQKFIARIVCAVGGGGARRGIFISGF
ncbi:MAG: hypothetical protein HDKAJFGB_03269 [Anaerolineae bacterium]|nr:hypothetical protein [Anaerolineae bacterium]